MSSNFDNIASNWDTPYRIERSQVISKKIIANIPDEAFSNILEFGCGTGLITFNIIDKIQKGLLIDTSENMISVVKQKISTSGYNNIIGQCIEISNIDINSGFSFVYSSMVLHHIDNIDLLAKTFYNILSKHGYLCIVDLCKDNGLFHKNEIGFKGHNGFDIKEMENIFSNNGFAIINSEIIYSGNKSIDNQDHRYELFIIRMRKI
jgi:ubiquinone/menaquinone biosynthesis C-methylase UbiE